MECFYWGGGSMNIEKKVSEWIDKNDLRPILFPPPVLVYSAKKVLVNRSMGCHKTEQLDWKF